MKRMILLAAICLCQIAVFGQKKYEMVVEKTDGTEAVFNVEDIVRTYFRERGTPDPDEPNLLKGSFPVGKWQECEPDGTLRNDATDYEVMHMNVYNNGTGEWWTVTKGQIDDYKYSFNYSYTFDGSSGSVTMTITTSTRQSDVGLSQTMPITYQNGIMHGGEIYYKKIQGTNDEENNKVDESIKSYTTCPDENHPHLIDLGLPSGTKWACCNVGASTPEENGMCFAWGETKWKGVYDMDSYQHGYNSIGVDIAGTRYDAATANWGLPWQMPSLEQCSELVNKCFSEWTTRKGINCCKFTGPNGGNIYLPATGYRSDNKQQDTGTIGCYWSSTRLGVDNIFSYGLSVSSGKVEGNRYFYRFYGLSVRPVCN